MINALKALIEQGKKLWKGHESSCGGLSMRVESVSLLAASPELISGHTEKVLPSNRDEDTAVLFHKTSYRQSESAAVV